MIDEIVADEYCEGTQDDEVVSRTNIGDTRGLEDLLSSLQPP